MSGCAKNYIVKKEENDDEGLVWFYLHYINICDYYREE